MISDRESDVLHLRVNFNPSGLTHQEPDNETTYSNSFKELSPRQSISIKLKASHHQIENFLVLAN